MNRVIFSRVLHPVFATRDYTDYVVIPTCNCEHEEACECALGAFCEFLIHVFPGFVRIPQGVAAFPYVMGNILHHIGTQ